MSMATLISAFANDADTLKNELYNRMMAEQNNFKEALKTKTPDEILDRAYVYSMRQNILNEFLFVDLSEEQLQTLLNLDLPLEYLCLYITKSPDYAKELNGCIGNAAIRLSERYEREKEKIRKSA
jgi:tagatose-1,6-bisphosphate aldolase non-catalytic subunit AgaZ/GatZ